MVTSARSRSSSSPRWRAEQQKYQLTAKQEAFVRSRSPVLLYRGGIASGKTIAGDIRSIVRRYAYPGTIQLIGGPSWDQVRDGTMTTLRRVLNPDCIAYENKVEHVIGLDNGSGFIFRTLDDPDVLRSLEFHDAYIDESALCAPQALDITLGRLRLPYADPTFMHSCWMTTTPRGMDWTLDVFGEEGREGYEVVHSTIYDNRSNLPDGYIERLEDKYRDTPFFEQELLGRYTAFEGLVYPMFTRETHVIAAPFALSDANVGVGLDWGGTAAPTAGVVLGESASGHGHVFREFYRVGATVTDIAIFLDDVARDAGLERRELRVWCDTTEQTAINELTSLGFGARRANKDRMTGIRYVAERFTAVNLTVDPSCPFTIGETGQYVWSRKKDGETKVVYVTNQPVDHHADAMDGLRYVAMGMVGTPPKRQPAGVPYTRYGGEVRA